MISSMLTHARCLHMSKERNKLLSLTQKYIITYFALLREVVPIFDTCATGNGTLSNVGVILEFLSVLLSRTGNDWFSLIGEGLEELVVLYEELSPKLQL